MLQALAVRAMAQIMSHFPRPADMKILHINYKLWQKNSRTFATREAASFVTIIFLQEIGDQQETYFDH